MRRIFFDDYVGFDIGIKLIQLCDEYPGREITLDTIHYNTYDGPDVMPPCVVPTSEYHIAAIIKGSKYLESSSPGSKIPYTRSFNNIVKSPRHPFWVQPDVTL